MIVESHLVIVILNAICLIKNAQKTYKIRWKINKRSFHFGPEEKN